MLALAQNPCCLTLDPDDPDVTVMRSGTPFALQTRTRPVPFPPQPWDYSISFSFGFGTDEVPVEGEILDSATLILRNTNAAVAAVLFSADANGFTWLPNSPGLLAISQDALQTEPADFIDIQPLPKQRLAYQVTFAVPSSLVAEGTELQLVLYDYPNGLNSVGWLGAVTVIPPPGRLEVTPESTFRSVGLAGGNFAPMRQTYSLTNAGGQPLIWRAMTSSSWLTPAPGHGSLASGAATNVTVRITSQVQAFEPGFYHSEITFTNASMEANTTTLPVELAVAAPAILEVGLSPVTNDEVILQLRGTPLVDYQIEASTNLTAWEPIRTVQPGADGTFAQAEQISMPFRFFRAVIVEPSSP